MNAANPKTKTHENSVPAPWTIADCLAATGGKLHGSDAGILFNRVSIDSRRIAGDDLFVAIKGDVHDGHGFADAVVKKGIRGLILERHKIDELPWNQWAAQSVACVAVKDTTRALGDMAVYHQDRNRASVAAITGSNGKTTTRRMTAAVVSRRFNTLSTRKNFNNDIGLPLTLLELCSAHQWAVVELGMNAPGEIDYLAGICRPDIGIITNIGPAHLEGVGSLEGVMNAKGELLGRIKAGGTAVLNADDPRVLTLAERTDRNVLLYGLTAAAAIRGRDVVTTNAGCTFTLALPDERVNVSLNIPGDFMVSNALAAAATGYQIGLSAEEIKTGLEAFVPEPGRMNIRHLDNGIHMIDDTYNANPGSMAAALNTLSVLRGNSRSIFVAGDMKELGQHAPSLHTDIGALAARTGIDLMFVTGEFADRMAAGAAAEGMNPRHIMTGTKQEILQSLVERLEPADWVLIKGSRSMAMEEIVQGLQQWADKNET